MLRILSPPFAMRTFPQETINFGSPSIILGTGRWMISVKYLAILERRSLAMEILLFGGRKIDRGSVHYFIRQANINDVNLTVCNNLFTSGKAFWSFFERIFEIIYQVNLFDVCFMNQPIIEIRPRGNFRPQACLNISTISLHPKGPCRPHWPAVSYIIWDMKHCMDCERTHWKARCSILIVYPEICEIQRLSFKIIPCLPFVFIYPVYNLILEFVYLIVRDLKLCAYLHDANEGHKVLVVTRLHETILENHRCDVHEPKCPTLCRHCGLVFHGVAEFPNKFGRNRTHGSLCFLPNFFPYVFWYNVVFATSVQALECTSPQIEQVF